MLADSRESRSHVDNQVHVTIRGLHHIAHGSHACRRSHAVHSGAASDHSLRSASRGDPAAPRAEGEYLAVLAGWIWQCKILSVIDREYPFTEAREALDRSRSFRARGKIVLRVGG